MWTAVATIVQPFGLVIGLIVNNASLIARPEIAIQIEELKCTLT